MSNNISISEINTSTDYIKNDDLLLVSSSNHSGTNSSPSSYTSAKINGLNLKISASMPPIENLKKFGYTSLVTREFQRETIQLSGENRYIAYFSVVLPVSSYVNVVGNFIMTREFMEANRTADQFLSIRFRNDSNQIQYTTLCTHTCGFVDSDDHYIWKGIQLSYWMGYAKANTEFILRSKFYTTAAQRDAFIAGTYEYEGNDFTRLALSYWSPTNAQ